MADNRLELLRSNIMSSNGVEEKVEGMATCLHLNIKQFMLTSFYVVNQRHLIDKILARYSAKYVLYRELMQNAGKYRLFNNDDSNLLTFFPLTLF
jgi:hypothetical protein